MILRKRKSLKFWSSESLKKVKIRRISSICGRVAAAPSNIIFRQNPQSKITLTKGYQQTVQKTSNSLDDIPIVLMTSNIIEDTKQSWRQTYSRDNNKQLDNKPVDSVWKGWQPCDVWNCDIQTTLPGGSYDAGVPGMVWSSASLSGLPVKVEISSFKYWNNNSVE